MANNNPNQNKDQGKQGGMQGQQQQGQQKSQQQNAGREVNPTRPSGEPGKLPQNAGSALDSGKTGTGTQQQQSKSQSAQGTDQSRSMREDSQRQSTPTRGKETPGGRDESEQDEDAATGIGQAVRKGEAESTDRGEDDLGHRNDKDRGRDKPM